jgi:predicted enzyme related to lactoylglutathione lyase
MSPTPARARAPIGWPDWHERRGATMSERDRYDHGVPSWVDHSSPDPAGAARFYGELFGWVAEDQMPPDAPGRYFRCRLRGRDVAALGTQQASDAPPMWNSYVTVDNADEIAAKVPAAGGRVHGEPFDVFDAGRMAVCQDQAGAWFCIWQAGTQPGAGLANEPGSFCWTELTTRDPEGSKRFYGAVFGWQATSADYGGVEYTMWHLGGVEPRQENAIAGMMPMVGDEWPADLPAHWMVYFAVEHAEATAVRCEQLGGKISVAPFDSPVGKIAVLNDSQGAVFSVLQMASPGR